MLRDIVSTRSDNGRLITILTLHNVITASSVTLARRHFDPFLARDVIYTSRAYATMSVSVCLSVCLCMRAHLVVVHAGNTAAAPASEVEAIIRSLTNMAAADVAAVEGRGHLALS